MKSIIPYVLFAMFWILVMTVGFLKAGLVVGATGILIIFLWNRAV